MTPREHAEAAGAVILRRVKDCGDDAEMVEPIEAAIRAAGAPLAAALREVLDAPNHRYAEVAQQARAALAAWEAGE